MMMEQIHLNLLSVRVVFSIIGVVGNTLLLVSILHTHTHLKSFELFLLALCSANLQQLVMVDVYDVLLLCSSSCIGVCSCRALRFLTVFGEVCSVLFTALISIYRYQKLHDVFSHVNVPVLLDSLRWAVCMCVLCVCVALAFGLPTLLVNTHWSVSNSSFERCPVDFFQCPSSSPCLTHIYKYVFLLVCVVLPLLVVTVTSVLMVRVLLVQQRAVRVREAEEPHPHHHHSSLLRSTLAILAAMMLFLLNWSMYLLLHLAFDPYSFPLWSEVEFFITTFYTALSPYVYGIGNDLFSVKRLYC